MKWHFRFLAFAIALLLGITIIGSTAFARNILPVKLMGQVVEENEAKKNEWVNQYIYSSGTDGGQSFNTTMQNDYYADHSKPGLSTGCASQYNPSCRCTPQGSYPSLSYNYVGGGC